MGKLKRGTQVACLPYHAYGDIDHRDVQHGFVVSGPTSEREYFCRFYYKNGNMRTKANSELVPVYRIHVYVSRPQEKVEEDLIKYCQGE